MSDTTVTPTGTELVAGWLEASPFVRHLGIRTVRLDDGEAELEMPFAPELVTIGDVVHGGAIATLIDSAATAAAWSGAQAPSRGTTVGLTVSYVAAARGSPVTAHARVVRRGSSLCFLEAEVRDATGGTVARALVTYKLG